MPFPPDFDLERATADLQCCGTIDELATRFARLILPLGMTASASGTFSGERAAAAPVIHFRNWPGDWLERYDREGFLHIDPLVRYAVVSGEPACWSAIYDACAPNDPGQRVRAAARQAGYSEGLLTPVRTRAGALGLVSVGGNPPGPLDRRTQSQLATLSATTLWHAEALLDAGTRPPLPRPLTTRERECVALLRAGMTDAEIARMMGVTHATVRAHMERAREKLGASNRAHLATLAMSGAPPVNVRGR